MEGYSKTERSQNVKEEDNNKQTNVNFPAEYLNNYGKPPSYIQNRQVFGVSANIWCRPISLEPIIEEC